MENINSTSWKHARVAQWLEHWSSKPGVDSSILSSGIKHLQFFFSSLVTADSIIILKNTPEHV
jgi:hypothetical protein